MLHVFLCRSDREGLYEFRSRPFPSLEALASFFASEAGDVWDRAEIRGHKHPYSAHLLRSMAAGERA